MTGGDSEDVTGAESSTHDSQDTQRDPAAQPTRLHEAASTAATPPDPTPTAPTVAYRPAGQPPPPSGRPEPPPPTLAPPNPSTRTGKYPAARWFHGITALIALAGLSLQLALVIDDPGSGIDVLSGIIDYFSSFTILSNIVVAILATGLMINPIRESPGFGSLRLDSLFMITLTGLIYLIVLAPSWNPTGWAAVADYTLHYAVPLLVLIGYGLFGPRPRLTFRNLAPSLIIPAVWVGYTLIRGALTNWYPYPFVDVSSHGYGTVLGNLLIISVIAIVLAAGFILLDSRLPWAPRR